MNPTPLLLPGQAAAPPGPADLSMMYLLHHGFRRDLARFPEAVRRTPFRDRATWRALPRRWDLFATLLDDHHHKEDEVVWPLLRQAAATAGDHAALEVIEAMSEEHLLIDPLLSEARSGLVALVQEPDERRRHEVVETMQMVGEVLGHHLAHEERDAIAVLQRHVDGAEWAELERTQLRGGLGLRDLLRMLPWVVQHVDPAIVERQLQEAGTGFRMLLALGRLSYRRLDEAAFHYVPEPVR